MRKQYIILTVFLLVVATMLWAHITDSIQFAEPMVVPREADAASVSETLPDEEDEPVIPTKSEVLVAREQALKGMTEEQVERLKEAVLVANLDWEHKYLKNNIFGRLEDPDDLEWNRFEQTGEIQIGWFLDGELGYDIEAICREENITKDEFYAQYGKRVVTENHEDANGFIERFGKLRDTVQDEALRADLQYIIDEMQLAKDTHEMEHVYNFYKKLHDLDYFLLRYGPEDVGKYVYDRSTVEKYYGTLSIY
ncbi:MAG: hypothetical protein K2O84_09940 [Oscillospiraceae bacterium]|nr:hypothetical protein [Oscillospiraceae bacterium]